MRVRLATLVVASAAGALAGTAPAKPPSPQPDPEDMPPVSPPPAGICPQYPHPTLPCGVVAVSCPSTAKIQVACKTVASAGQADAHTQKLELQLPRRYAEAGLTCRTDAKTRVSCRITSRTLVTATGVHTAVVRLPNAFTAIRLACGTVKSKFGCKLRK